MSSRIERRIAVADTLAGSASWTRTTGSSCGYRGGVSSQQNDGEGWSLATRRRRKPRVIRCLLLSAVLLALCFATNAQAATSPSPAVAEHFSEAVVTIRIDAEDKISLDSESAIIFFDPLLRDPRKARQVRWLVACEDGLIMPGGTIGRCPREDEMVVVRPEPDQPDELHWMFSHQREDGPRTVRGKNAWSSPTATTRSPAACLFPLISTSFRPSDGLMKSSSGELTSWWLPSMGSFG